MNVILLPKGCKNLIVVQLPDPKSSQLRDYFYDEDNITIYENIQYSDEFRSWFLDNEFCREGNMSILTRVDPLFIMGPHIRKVASTQFRSLQDICSTLESSNYVLAPNTRWSHICETKDVDNELFIRWSESKTIDWLVAKRAVIMEALKRQQIPSAKLMLYANDFLDQYITRDLSDKLKSITKMELPIKSIETGRS